MPAKRILLFDGARLTAHLWHAGQLDREGEFQPGPPGLQAFQGYLGQHRSSLFYLLANVAEEGFLIDDLPYVRGRDRTALIKRRLGQHYYATPLAVALSLGRSNNARRDEQVLFAALTRHDAFVPWLDAIRSADASLVGLYSVPLLLADVAPRLAGIGSDPALIVTLTHTGVRQSFFAGGKLHFSRLSQLALRSRDEIAIACASEVAKIHHYLINQPKFPRSPTLRTIVLAHPDQIPSLQAHCRDTAELVFDFIDLGAVASRAKLKTPVTDSRADTLLMHLLALRPPTRQFAQSIELRTHRLRQTRFALVSAAGIILAVCLLIAARTGLQLLDAHRHIELVRAEAASDAQRYDAILAGLPKIAISPDNLRRLIGRHEELDKRAGLLPPMLAHLGQALLETPHIELSRLDWALAEHKDGGEKVGAGTTATIAPSTAGDAWATLTLQGRLPPALANDLRAQIDIVEQFSARLRRPGYAVQMLSAPFDTESAKPLRSRTAISGTGTVPQFSLRLARTF